MGQLLFWGVVLPFTFGGYACGSGGSSHGNGNGNEPSGSPCAANSECASGLCMAGTCSTGAPGGSDCSADGECASGVCVAGTCQGNGVGAPAGSPCDDAADCASGTCQAGVCGAGTGLADGRSCASAGECTSGACTSGICGTGTSGSTSTTTGPQYGGSGDSFRPLVAGCGPDTAEQCTGTCEQAGGDPNVTVIRPPATLCFSGAGDLTPEDPTAVIEQSIETVNGQTYVHIRVTFDPTFVDNTYGENSCTECGWPADKAHTFKDLVGSDHTELLLTNGAGDTVINFKVDYVTADLGSSCAYGTLGVAGGEGSVIVGDPSWVLATSTSIDRNINGCGYCQSPACGSSGNCTLDSPATDPNYTTNSQAPNWDFRQVYEVWIDYAAFESAGFGQAYITYVHASPNKSLLKTIEVTPTPCPPDWDTPYCPPNVAQEGGNCFGGGGGSGGGGGDSCPVNQQVYITTEGASLCTPIPWSNYDGMKPCPDGYTLDLATEGQYCVPN
jgi:hypothetical protein